jgi:hypothetical protein
VSGAGDSRGFALAAAVFALVLIAALLAGVFFAALQELRLGRNALGAERAFAAAEAGVAAALADWDPARCDVLRDGQSAAFSGALPAGTGAYAGSVTRLHGTLFLIRSRGRDAATSAQREVAQVVRLTPPPLDLRAAVTVEDRLAVAGAALIAGDGEPPAGWACPTAGAGVGVRIADASRVSISGCPPASCIRGEPAVMGDSSVGDSVARRLLDAAWSELARQAAKTYPAGSGPVAGLGPVGTATACDSSIVGNWGDPGSPPSVAGCADYFPVVLAEGDLRIQGGSGQGILLVQGDLVVDGGFQFRGVLLVRGTLTLLGLGGRLLGAVRASSVDLRPSGPTGVAELRYSGCVTRTILLGNATATPLARRGWGEVF